MEYDVAIVGAGPAGASAAYFLTEAGKRVLVTFNGKSFDWPLLETRYRMTRTAMTESPAVHLDLLHPSRQLWRLRLKSVALGELEKIQRFWVLKRWPRASSISRSSGLL